MFHLTIIYDVTSTQMNIVYVHDSMDLADILRITCEMNKHNTRVCVPNNVELISRYGFTNCEDGRDDIYLLMDTPFDTSMCYSPIDFEKYEHRICRPPKRRKINHLPS